MELTQEHRKMCLVSLERGLEIKHSLDIQMLNEIDKINSSTNNELRDPLMKASIEVDMFLCVKQIELLKSALINNKIDF